MHVILCCEHNGGTTSLSHEAASHSSACTYHSMYVCAPNPNCNPINPNPKCNPIMNTACNTQPLYVPSSNPHCPSPAPSVAWSLLIAYLFGRFMPRAASR